MEDPTSNAPAKKLKLTLKLGSSGSSSSSSGSNSLNSSALSSSKSTSPAGSSIDASPVKAKEIETSKSDSNNLNISELPSGIGNLKGRGRPKKAEEAGDGDNLAPQIISQIGIQTTSSNIPTTNPTASNADYLKELKSFVATMKTFKPRSWTLTKSVPYELKTVSGYELALPCGFWCTNTASLGSESLKQVTLLSNSKDVPEAPTAFGATCQCGKVFNDRSKYRKHIKIHDKPSAEPSIQISNEPQKEVPKTPSISLKIKLNTSNINK